MPSSFPFEVLIVGAGPTGLMQANELTRQGVSCRIIDKASTFSREPKALGIQAKTLELFEKMGLAETALAQGLTVRYFHILSENNGSDSICVKAHPHFS